MTKISQLSSIGDSLAIGDQFLIRDIDDAGSPNKSVTVSGITRALADGDATAPALAFAADKNTGIYRAGTDSLAVATNGVGRLFVDASGNVNIGSAIGYGETLGVRGTFMAQATNVVNRITEAGSVGYWGTVTNHDLAFQTNGTEKLRITAAGLVGIGISSPGDKLHVVDAGTAVGTGSLVARFMDATNAKGVFLGYDTNELGGTIYGANLLTFQTFNGSAWGERVRISEAGLVGIGTTSPGRTLDVVGTAKFSNGTADVTIYGDLTTFGALGTNSNFPLALYTNGAEKARLDTSGRLLVGTSTSVAVAGTAAVQQIIGNATNDRPLGLHWGGANITAPYIQFSKSRNATYGSYTIVSDGDVLGGLLFAGDDGTDYATLGAAIEAYVDGAPGVDDLPCRLVFSTTSDSASSPTERMRIDSAGTVVLAPTYPNTSPETNTLDAAVALRCPSGSHVQFSKSSASVAGFNRLTDDGTIISLRQAGTEEGTISVSGTTVSYNGGHLSRWSQLPSGAERTEILRGSVLSNIDEMCEWGDEDNEQLNRMKVSDVEGDKNVSGVFQAWDDDDDTYTDDFYCAMTGDFIIRIAEGVTVERGDLLMSAGDGTAKPQDDDIIRSKTIAKVTSTNVSCTYEDGSYCVPCALMAC